MWSCDPLSPNVRNVAVRVYPSRGYNHVTVEGFQSGQLFHPSPIKSMITIRLTKDEITPDLHRILKSVEPGGALGKVLGRAAANELKAWFRELNAKRPNKLGGERSHFWNAVASSVQNPRTTPGGITVAISHPHIAQRLFGGTILPRKRKLLAIPVHAAAYGVYPRIYPGALAYIPLRGRGQTKGVIVAGEEYTTRKGAKRTRPKPGGPILYVLRGAVTQRADPSVLPPSSRMADALTRAARLVRPGGA